MIFVYKIGVILIILTILMICGMLGKLLSTLLLKNMPHFVQSVHVKASKSPWITSHLKDEMHKRDIQKIKAVRSNDSEDWISFKKMRNSVNQKIFQAKETYFKNTFLRE